MRSRRSRGRDRSSTSSESPRAIRERPALSALPRGAGAAVAAARELAKRRGARLYLAGGVVRDLLSGRVIRDVDLAVEEPLPEFARRLAERLGAALRVHERFGTATLTLADGPRLDIASTRREVYASPGALPSVSLGASIEEDLARRDFTWNAMAIEIAPRWRLVDPFGGREDLSRGVLRALHARSFLDDPTRAFRAVRYANRFGFRIAPKTRRAILRAMAVGAFDRVSGDRLRSELVKIFSEPGAAAAVRSLRRLHLDAAIEPSLAQAAGVGPRLREAEGLARLRSDGVTWLCYLLAWMTDLKLETVRRVVSRLDVVGKDRARLLAWPRTLRRLRRGVARRRPSGIAAATAGLSVDEIVAAAAALNTADRRALLAAAQNHAGAGLRIRGSDLLAAGIPSGATMGKALAATRDARLDGRISESEELEFAVRAARAMGRRK